VERNGMKKNFLFIHHPFLMVEFAGGFLVHSGQVWMINWASST
jgi:hypothetical protein